MSNVILPKNPETQHEPKQNAVFVYSHKNQID